MVFIALFTMPECNFKEELVNLLLYIALEVRIQQYKGHMVFLIKMLNKAVLTAIL